ncbi:MAG: CAP domain-containing protein [Actinomycetota bacterium]
MEHAANSALETRSGTGRATLGFVRRRAALVVAVVAVSIAGGSLAAPSGASADQITPNFITPDADWLTTVNYFRAMAGVAPVSEDPVLSAGDVKHSCYMLQNGMSHDETPGAPGYSLEGKSAGNNGNVAVSSGIGATPRNHIELWMTGPFHAIGVLRPQLARVGFGMCTNPNTSPWHSGATLDVLRGLTNAPRPATPILFPGDGTTTNLTRFVVETPNPLPYCGWSGSAGLPVIAMMPEAVTGNVSASIVGPNGPLETCALSRLNTDGTAQVLLGGDNAVVAIPHATLEPGNYTVTVTTQARTVTWSFTVDPAAATGVVAPAASAQPEASRVGFTPLSPARVVDTRANVGATRLQAGIQQRIQVVGRGGVPAGSVAVSGNFTVVAPAATSYVTVWDCAGTRPTVSTLNFAAAETLPNAANISLDANGGLCVYSPVSLDLVIDVNGAFEPSATSRFAPASPYRVMDTRAGLGANRLGADETVSLQVGGTEAVPANATAVTMNVTSVNAGRTGYVTVYPCGGDRPIVSNLNPQPGQVRPNMVTVPLAADGTVCFYTLNDVDLVADVTGYYSTTSTTEYTPTTPFRYVDTRDGNRIEVNAGNGGRPIVGGQTVMVQIAGRRGVPTGVRAVSVNLTTANSSADGYVTAWPCDTQPNASTANMRIGSAVSNAATLPLSADGMLCLYTQTTTHVVIDVNGWWN